MKKILATAAMMTILAAVPAMAAEWKQDAVGWYYEYSTGGYAKNEILEIDGSKYCFDANGYMVTGWKMVDGSWHYFNSDGRMPMGWIQDNGKWYYLNSDGSMKIGWFNDGKNMYYFYNAADAQSLRNAVEGAMAIGYIQVNGVTYYFDGSGKLDTKQTPTEQNGIRYRNQEGVFQWENINKKNDWIQYTSKEEQAFDIQEQLLERYEGKHSYSDSVQFEQDAKKYLQDIMSNDEIELFVDEAWEEYFGRSTGRYNDDDDED